MDTLFQESPALASVVTNSAHISETVTPVLKVEHGGNDTQGVRMFYNQYAHLLYGTILRIVPAKATADKVLEQLFITLQDEWDLISTKKVRPITHAIGLAKRLAGEQLRKSGLGQNDVRGRGRDLEILLPGALTSESAWLIKKLFIESFSTTDAAKKVRLSVKELRSRFHRAIDHFHSLCSGNFGFSPEGINKAPHHEHFGFRADDYEYNRNLNKLLFEDSPSRIRSRYLGLFNNPFFGVFRMQLSSFRLIAANLKFREIFQIVDNDEVKPLDQYFKDYDLNNAISEAIKNGKVVDLEMEAIASNGKKIWISANFNHVKEEQAIEGALIDITNRKHQVIELHRLNHELDQFVYHASHDLRAPIATIEGLVNLIKIHTKNADQTLAELVNMIEDRARHLDLVLSDLIAISYNNNMVIRNEDTCVRDELDAILADYVHCKDVEFVCQFDVPEGMRLYSDPIRLRTILRNLISNSYKYRRKEVDRSFIRFDLRLDEDEVMFKVSDNGIGIENDQQYQIFGMFYRGTTFSKGTGLGLYIVKSMIDKLGGTIAVRSQYGLGTEFTIRIPNGAGIRKAVSEKHFCFDPSHFMYVGAKPNV